MGGPVAVLGATGFVGSAVVLALESGGFEVREIRAPRLREAGVDASHIRLSFASDPVVDVLSAELKGCAGVVNAAGLAKPDANDWSSLAGANARLPGVVAAAAGAAGVKRMVHVSSMAVQGRRRLLDASASYGSFSPYSRSKELGERVLLAMAANGAPEIVILRPGSVHGAGRATTRSLLRVARSRLSSVAGTGDAPSPQNLVENVAAAVAFLVRAATPPQIVLQPWEGMTTAELLRQLGGREPHHLPAPLARAALVPLQAGGAVSARAWAWSRRLELLWFGQPQQAGYLEASTFEPSSGAGWNRLSAGSHPASSAPSHLVRTLAGANTRSDA